MNRLIVTVPIQLVSNDEGFWLQIETPTKREATVKVPEFVDGPLAQGIWKEWAEAVLKQAQLKARRATGVNDAHGNPILEGDIVMTQAGENYPQAPGVVEWDRSLAAFILTGRFKGSYNVWRTQNLGGVRKYSVIGNVFETPELLTPAEPLDPEKSIQ